MPKKCSLEIDGLHGTAAQLRFISKQGGWDQYHITLVSRITKAVFNDMKKFR